MKKLKDLKVGEEVNYHDIITPKGPKYDEPTSTGHRVEAMAMMNGGLVVWISGKSGCVAFEALSKP